MVTAIVGGSIGVAGIGSVTDISQIVSATEALVHTGDTDDVARIGYMRRNFAFNAGKRQQFREAELIQQFYRRGSSPSPAY
jgi:hypothetical protein